MTAHKSIRPWSLLELTTGVRFGDVLELYRRTAKAPGLVHAASGPIRDGEVYHVTLAPLGKEGQHESFGDELTVQRLTHGLLHGLSAIHEVLRRGQGF